MKGSPDLFSDESYGHDNTIRMNTRAKAQCVKSKMGRPSIQKKQVSSLIFVLLSDLNLSVSQ